MARMNIYVPDPLKAKIDEIKSVNWSAVAQAAFEREVNHLLKMKELTGMEAVAERLRQSKFELIDKRIDEAREAGRKWASEEATYIELSDLARHTYWDDSLAEGLFNELIFKVQGESEDTNGFWNQQLNSLSPEGFRVVAFVEGAMAVWEAVKDEI